MTGAAQGDSADLGRALVFAFGLVLGIVGLSILLPQAMFWHSGPAAAAAEPSRPSYTPQEEWVIRQVVAGEIADLEKQFPEKIARVIRAFLLDGLLTDSVPGAKVHQRGVRIVHATVTGPLDVRNANVVHETWLDECELTDTVLFSRARFQGLLSFDGSSLAAADFDAMRVGGNVFFRRARFAGPRGGAGWPGS